MKKDNMVFFEISKEESKYIKDRLKGYKLLFFEQNINEVNPIKYKNANIISVFIYSKINKDIIDNCSNLKSILTRSTGYDHIDIDYAKSKNIVIGNVPFYGENTVAEHTFALILNLSRKVHLSYLRTKENNYSIDGLRGFDLKDKTLGIIGVGNIGMHVIKIAKGFGMHVKAYDINEDSFLSELLHFEYADLNTILKQSDIITLHMPDNKHTHHFLDKKKMSKLKNSAIIINTSRGGLIDTNALYDNLKKGKIAGAGLDVIEGEELINYEEELLKNNFSRKKLYEIYRNKEIFKMDNVIFTPHNAFNSIEAINRINDTTIESIKDFSKNNKIKYKL